MKFKILKDNLKKGLSIVAHLTNKNINLPILNNILIKAKKEGIELISTNLEISVNHFLRGQTDDEGEVTVNSKLINEYISLLPEDKIEVEKKGNNLNIKCQNHKTKIVSQGVEDFPAIPSLKEVNLFIVEIKKIKEALSRVIFSVSTSDSRLELSGVLFVFEEDELTLVGTDSYRLAERKIKIKKEKKSENKKIIVPAKTIQELIRILNNFKTEEELSNSDELKITLNESQILFSFASTKIISRIITGNYPDYEQIIPKKEKTKVIVNKNELSRAIKSAGIFSKTGINDIELRFKKEKITIFSSSSQTGENSVDVPSKTSGEDNNVFVNYKYLLEGLNNMKSEDVEIKVVDNNFPCVVKEKEEEGYLYLVMPIKQ
jgi:DNA polymerase III subunit beta